jgi:hypothetical protein
MHAPGFYKTNYRAFRIRDLILFYGPLRLPKTFIATRYRKKASHGIWMPSLAADTACERKDIPDRFWNITAPHCRAFEQLGFSELTYGSLKPHQHLNPYVQETCSIRYLHSDQAYIGGLFYVRTHAGPPLNRTSEKVFLSFTAAFQTGGLICTNRKRTLEAAPQFRTTRLTSDNVQELYERFLKDLKRSKQRPLSFPNAESFRQWFDKGQLANFEHRVNRGLYIKMTAPEVATARRKLPPQIPKQ